MRKLSENNHGWAVVMAGVIGGLVAIVIGVLVWYKINTAIFAAGPGSMVGPRVALNTTYAGVNATANTIWGLFPIVAIVVIAGIVLAIVMGFGRGNKS